MDFKALGGMSGGPAFVSRGLHFQFVGVVSDYSESYDTVFFSAAAAIRRDGSIERPPV